MSHESSLKCAHAHAELPSWQCLLLSGSTQRKTLARQPQTALVPVLKVKQDSWHVHHTLAKDPPVLVVLCRLLKADDVADEPALASIQTNLCADDLSATTCSPKWGVSPSCNEQPVWSPITGRWRVRIQTQMLVVIRLQALRSQPQVAGNSCLAAHEHSSLAAWKPTGCRCGQSDIHFMGHRCSNASHGCSAAKLHAPQALHDTSNPLACKLT